MSDVSEPKSRGAIGRRIAEAFAGAGAGFLVWSIFGPGALGWWYEPPVKEVVSCAGAVRAAVGQFVVAQLVSALVGAVALSVVLFLSRRWWQKRKAVSAPASPPSPPSAGS